VKNIEKNESKDQRFIADLKLDVQFVEFHIITTGTRLRQWPREELRSRRFLKGIIV